MIVIIQPRFFQFCRLLSCQHAQCHTGFHTHCAHALYHLAHRIHIAVFRATPCRAHAIARGTGIFGTLRPLQHRLDIHQLGGFEAGIKFGALTAIIAIFRTAAGFNRQKRAFLYLIGIKPLSMHILRFKNQIIERQGKQRLNLFTGPIISWLYRARRSTHFNRFRHLFLFNSQFFCSKRVLFCEACTRCGRRFRRTCKALRF